MDNVQPGQNLGPYRILNQVGQGGMATVYRAYHAAMDRYVAVKILPRQLAESPEFVGRFQQEARTIARLEHAHILPVHDYGEADGYTYLVMRYLEAGTLKDRLQAGALPLPEADRLFSQLADALDYAHAQGIVHRDLKPSNVLLDARGSLFLTDFGIAKLLQGTANFTSTGAMIGTPAYMSPEQAQGLPVDQRSDLYSLGIILYEMVTGRVPFEADTPLAVILKQVSAPLPPPSSVRPGLSASIEKVLLKVLSKDPNERYASADELMAAWKAALHSAAQPTLTAAAATVADPRPAQPAIPAGSPPAQPGTPPPAAPARRNLRVFGPVGIVGALAVLLCGGGLCAVFVFNQFFNPSNAGTPVAAGTGAPTGAATDPVGEATPQATDFLTAFAPGDATNAPVATPVPPPGLTGTWQSWTARNTVFDVAVYGDQLLTGGPGGVVVWDLNTGEVVDHIHTGNGLPGVYVTQLLVDPGTGHLFIATDDGLLEYHGDTVTLHDADSGLDSSFVSAVAVASDGLVVGTQFSEEEGGGVLVQVGEDEWESLGDFPSTSDTDANPDLLSNAVTALVVDEANGVVWVATENGLGRYDGSAWERFSTDEGLPDNYITALALVDDVLFVGTDSGLATFNGEAFEVVPDVDFSPVWGLVSASDGSLWASGGGGVARRNPDGTADYWSYTQLTSYGNYRGVEAPDGRLFFGTDVGVLTFSGDDFTEWTAPNVPVSAAFDAVRLEPATGWLWFKEEYGARVDIYEPANDAWFSAPDADCSCTPRAWDEDGRLWAASEMGLWIFDGTEPVETFTTENGLPHDDVRAVAPASGGTAWIATLGGLVYYDNGEITQVFDTENSELVSDEVISLLLASDGSVWAGTTGGLSRRLPDGTWETYSTDNPFSDAVRIHDLAEAPNGDIWAATDGDGLARFRPEDGAWDLFSPERAGVNLPTDVITSVAVGPDGTVWAGLYYAGAARFDGEAWLPFGVDEGLIHSNVNDIYVDEGGTVWFATSGGVTRYVP